MNQHTWRTKDGEEILISKLTDTHLTNIIRRLERWAENCRVAVPFPMLNGEMAQYHAEQAFDALHEMDAEELVEYFSPCPARIERLYAEARKRDLAVVNFG